MEFTISFSGVALFALPTLIAWIRGHHECTAIVVLNALAAVPTIYYSIIRSELESEKIMMLMICFLMWSWAAVWSARRLT